MKQRLFNRNDAKLAQSTLYRMPDSVSTERDGEAVILTSTNGVYHCLDLVNTMSRHPLEKPVTIRAESNRL